MLVLDLLALFHVVNQGMINILGHFFEMSKSDSERAMEIYRRFTKQTDLVVNYLATARTYEHQTRVEVPKLKHAPVNLGKQLEDYLADPDFEINRRQYIAEQEAKKFGGKKKPFSDSTKASTSAGASKSPFPEPKTASQGPASKPAPGPAPDLIDFFDSIEQNQQPLAASQSQQQAHVQQQFGVQQPQQFPVQYGQNGFDQQQAQQTGFQQAPQQQPFAAGFQAQHQPQQPQQPQQLQPNFTGAGFGGYTPQPQPQAQTQTFQSTLSPISQSTPSQFPQPGIQQPQQTGFLPNPIQQQVTNPFRASMMMNANMQNLMGQQQQQPQMGLQPQQSLSPQNTNPFAKPSHAATFPLTAPQQSQTPPQLQSQPTGTNPFARPQPSSSLSTGSAQSAPGLMPQPTGSTNPFRQSQFVNTATGTPWQQQNQIPIGGGLDQLETIPVFPRPAQQQPWAQ
jgi:hypothetical protein